MKFTLYNRREARSNYKQCRVGISNLKNVSLIFCRVDEIFGVCVCCVWGVCLRGAVHLIEEVAESGCKCECLIYGNG